MASAVDLGALNSHLMDKSYVNDEFEPTQADVALWTSLKSRAKELNAFPYAVRWFSHISSFDESEKKTFPSVKDDLSVILANMSLR